MDGRGARLCLGGGRARSAARAWSCALILTLTGPVGAAPPPAAAPAETSRAADGSGGWGSLAALTGGYGGLAVWAYFAWYRNMATREFHYGGEGLFERDTYAGGADKVGHFWSNLACTRLGSELLVLDGWGPRPASLLAGGMTTALFTLFELKDGYYTQFSPGDLAANLGGVALALLMVQLPTVDDLFDLRIDYVPSPLFRRQGSVDVGNDYSGQTCLAALHLGALPGVWGMESPAWLGYLDLAVGYRTRGYLPRPTDPGAPARQELFLGVALDLQHVLAVATNDSRSGWRRAGHLALELYAPPYTTLPVATASRRGSRPATE